MKKGLFSLSFISLMLLSCAPISDQQAIEQRISELEIKVARIEEKLDEVETKMEEINKRLDLIAAREGRKRIYRETAQETVREEMVAEEEEQVTSEEENPDIAYQEALELYRMKKLYEARDLFIDFIKKYPPNKYTDNAYFWLGKIYYELGNKERAHQLFNVLIKKCNEGELPDCNKLPDTYFMLLKMALDEGDIGKANEYLSLLENKFPDSEATHRAKELLLKQP